MTPRADLVLRELDACRGRVLQASAEEWTRPTPCAGWDVEALARHLAAVAWQQAEAFHRARVGVTEAPSWLEIGGDRAHVLDALSAAREHLAAALASVAASPETIVPLPFAPLPAPIALDALVLEYGVHRHDLERALGRATDIDLDADVARVVAGLVPALVPLLAEKPAVTPITYQLAGDSASAAITWRDDAWHAGVGDGPVCELRGPDAAIALLALGRIDPTHPALTVTGETAAATDLTHHLRTL
jgi:uncharacterized protein (TIGR03083 family)